MKSYGIILSVCAVLLGFSVGAANGATSESQTDTTQAPKAKVVTLTYAQRRGKRLFAHYCAICHGEKGAGDGFNAYNLAPVHPRNLTDKAYMSKLSDDWLKEIITEGGRGTRKSVLMPAWGNTLTADQIDELAAFVRTLSQK